MMQQARNKQRVVRHRRELDEPDRAIAGAGVGVRPNGVEQHTVTWREGRQRGVVQGGQGRPRGDRWTGAGEFQQGGGVAADASGCVVWILQAADVEDDIRPRLRAGVGWVQGHVAFIVDRVVLCTPGGIGGWDDIFVAGAVCADGADRSGGDDVFDGGGVALRVCPGRGGRGVDAAPHGSAIGAVGIGDVGVGVWRARDA